MNATNQPLTEDDFDMLREAGASAAFMRVLRTHPETVGISRHSVREGVRKLLDGDRSVDGLAASVPSVGGDFFTNLWEGNLMEAFVHADGNNMRLMTRVFDPEEYLVDAQEHHRWDVPYAKRILHERFERYGPDGVVVPEPPER